MKNGENAGEPDLKVYPESVSLTEGQQLADYIECQRIADHHSHPISDMRPKNNAATISMLLDFVVALEKRVIYLENKDG